MRLHVRVQHLAHDRDRLRHRHRPFRALRRDRERREADMRNARLVGDVGHRHGRRRRRGPHDDVGLGLRDEAPRIGGGVGRIAAVVEHDDLERHAGDFLGHEFERVALGNAERRRGSGGRDGDADDDFVGLRQRGQPRQREQTPRSPRRTGKTSSSIPPLVLFRRKFVGFSPSLGDACLVSPA